MKFGIIDPVAKTFRVHDVPSIGAAYALAHLDPTATDHGVIARLENGHHVCFVVYEYGFFVPVADQHYFGIDYRLIAGHAMVYEADAFGVTVDLSDEAVALIDEPKWFDSADEIEAAIAVGTTVRPEMRVNGEVIWSWPEPGPREMTERMK